MKNLEQIANKVYGKINENTIMVYYNADLNNIPGFMCSPFSDGWFGSNSTKELIDYIFNIIIADYMLDSVMAFGDFDKVDEEEYDFEKSYKTYIAYKTINSTRCENLEKLRMLYAQNIDKEITYFEFVKLLVALEECTPNLGVELYFESYSTPYEARHSENLATERFDFEDLNENF